MVSQVIVNISKRSVSMKLRKSAIISNEEGLSHMVIRSIFAMRLFCT